MHSVHKDNMMNDLARSLTLLQTHDVVTTHVDTEYIYAFMRVIASGVPRRGFYADVYDVESDIHNTSIGCRVGGVIQSINTSLDMFRCKEDCLEPGKTYDLSRMVVTYSSSKPEDQGLPYIPIFEIDIALNGRDLLFNFTVSYKPASSSAIDIPGNRKSSSSSYHIKIDPISYRRIVNNVRVYTTSDGIHRTMNTHLLFGVVEDFLRERIMEKSADLEI